MSANDRQVGGDHYGPGKKVQHWDLALRMSPLYCAIQITRYLCRDKNPEEDLKKATHYFDKWLEHRSHMTAAAQEWFDESEIPKELHDLLLSCYLGDFHMAYEWFHVYLQEQLRKKLDLEKLATLASHNALDEVLSDTGEALDVIDSGEPQAHGYVNQDPPLDYAVGDEDDGEIEPPPVTPPRAPKVSRDPRPPRPHECVVDDIWIESLGGGTDEWWWRWDGKVWRDMERKSR